MHKKDLLNRKKLKLVRQLRGTSTGDKWLNIGSAATAV